MVSIKKTHETFRRWNRMETLYTFLPIILMFVIFYFLLIRPQQKRQKQVREMQANIEKGDKIITMGGLHGTIDAIHEDVIVVDCGSTKLPDDRAAIREVKVDQITSDIRKKMWIPESYKNSAHRIYSLSAGVSHIPFARFTLSSFSTRKSAYSLYGKQVLIQKEANRL